MRRLFLFFCLWYLISPCWGQSLSVYNISIAEGLPSSEVYEVFQDSNRFIWFATDNGVVKFDGRQMETFHVKDGLIDPVVFGFHEDKKGRIWLRTFSGKMFYYENGKINPYRYNKLLVGLVNKSYVFNMYVEKDDFWFSDRSVMGKIDSSGTFHKDLVEKSTLFYKTIGSGFIMGADILDTIIQVKINRQKFVIDPINQLQLTRVFCSITWKNKIYISIKNQIFEYNGKSLHKILTTKAEIISLSKDKEDNLWIGYVTNGVEKFTNGIFKNPWRVNIINNKSVTKVLQDHEGGYWFTTLEKGVYYVPNLIIKHWAFPKEIKVTSAISTPSYIAVSDQSGGVYAYHLHNKSLLWQKSFGIDAHIHTLFYHNKKLLISLVSRNCQFYILEKSNRIRSIPNISVTSLTKGKDDVLWGIGSSAITKLDKDGNLIFSKPVTLRHRRICVDDSLFYLALRSGLQVADVRLNTFTSIEKLADFKISQLASLNDSTLLIATIGRGFLLLNKRNWTYTQFNYHHNFIANNIYAFIKNDSMLWLGTEKGLISTYIKPLLKGDFSYNKITRQSGLMSDKINFLVSAESDLWVFTDDGFSVIPYTNHKFSNKTPELYFKRLTVNNKPITFKTRIELKHDQNNIQIFFGYISFNNQNIITRFRLAPNRPWLKTNDRNIQLASLSPGNYNIEFEYSTDNIKWTQANYPLLIVITPPWWERWYVRLGGFIILMSLIYIYYKKQMLIYKHRDQYLKVVNESKQNLINSEIITLERERSRIAKDLHDGVGTNLTAIKLFMGQLIRVNNLSEGNVVEEQLQNTIKEIKDIIYELTPPGLERYGLIASLKNYIEKLNNTIPLKIELNKFGEETFDVHLNIMIFRVVQELISNSLKHANANNIFIHVNSFRDLLSIIYEDDGIGFAPDIVKKGLGLDNIEARIQSINGNLKFESGKFGISYIIDIPLN